jgi:hypothetical protein
MIFLDTLLPVAAKSKPAANSDNDLDDHAKQEWQQNLLEYMLFRSKHGGDATPDAKSDDKGERALAKWLKVQYQSDVDLKEGKPSDVPAKYIDILRNQLVGFPFKYAGLLSELREYKSEHGHTQVPCRYHTSLGQSLRNIKKKRKSNKLEEWMIKDLDELEFEWELTPVVVWDKSFKQLKDYKELHGHCKSFCCCCCCQRRGCVFW